MKLNYQIMNESQKTERGYLPNYDELIANSSCEEEANKWKEVQSRNFTFAFRGVYATKQACGHWEIFQHPISDVRTIEEMIEFAESHADRKCTRCICGW